MRPLLAALLTTVVPAVAGQRWFVARWPLRWSLGALTGIAAVACGGVLGGLAGSFPLGAGGAVVLLGVVPARHRVDLGDRPLPDVVKVLLGLVAVTGATMMVLAGFRPVAYWDGWSFWSMKAKGLADAGSFDSPVFVGRAYANSHPDYPPALSSWQAAAYQVSGDLSVAWPLQFQLAWLWTAGGVAVVGLASRWSTVAATIAFAWVAAPGVVLHAMHGDADVPLAVFLVVGTALAVSARGTAPALAAGLLLAAAALTKNEGLVLAVGVLAVLVVLPAVAPVSRRQSALAGAVTAVVALPWFLYVRSQGLANEVVNSGTLSADRAGSLLGERIGRIVAGMAGEVLAVPRWFLLVPLAVAALLLGRVPWALLAATALSTSVFAAVYLVTPVSYHLEGSVARVMIAPLGLLTVCAARALAPDPFPRQ